MESGIEDGQDVKDDVSFSTAVTDETQNVELMETNQETAPVVQESVNTEENIENSNVEQATEQKTEPSVEEKITQDEVETAVNEQELKYWNAVHENPQDFTSWTYLLQFVEQEVEIYIILVFVQNDQSMSSMKRDYPRRMGNVGL